MTRLGAFTRALGLAALSIAILFDAGAVRAAEANQPDTAPIALAYDPSTEALLKAEANALYRSGDGGQSWQKIAMPSPEDGMIAAVATYVAGPGLGVVRTDDGGKTWVERTEGLPSRDVIAVAAHTTQPDTVYAVVKKQGIYRSQDAGQSWRMMDRGPRDGLVQLIHSDMAGSMQTGWLFAATSNGIRRIMDCFCLWQDAGGLASEARSVTYDPKQPEHIYAATKKGLFRSTDGGENWNEMASPISKAVALAFAPSGTLYVINADGRLFRSADQGVTWAPVNV